MVTLLLFALGGLAWVVFCLAWPPAGFLGLALFSWTLAAVRARNESRS